MKIVNILYSGLGGHSSVVFSLIEADVNKEYDHVLIFYGIEDMPASYEEKCTELGIRFFFVKKKQGLDIGSQKAVIDILKKVKPGVILLHSVNLVLPVYRYVLANNTRLVSVEHQPNHQKTKREWVWSVLLMQLSQKVVYLTDLYASQMKKHLGLLYQPGKVSVINNGINTDLFKPSALPVSENNTIGMLARLTGSKDHLTLLDAFKELLDKDEENNTLRLKIAGDGDMMDQLKTKTTELGITTSVDFMGMIPEHLNPVFLNSLAIYIHASLGETMSTSLMQAMACAKPIIASDVAGINNMLIDGETGILVPPKNKEMLADSIGSLLQDINRRNVLSENALQYSRAHFTNTAMFEKYRQLFV